MNYKKAEKAGYDERLCFINPDDLLHSFNFFKIMYQVIQMACVVHIKHNGSDESACLAFNTY